MEPAVGVWLGVDVVLFKAMQSHVKQPIGMNITTGTVAIILS